MTPQVGVDFIHGQKLRLLYKRSSEPEKSNLRISYENLAADGICPYPSN